MSDVVVLHSDWRQSIARAINGFLVAGHVAGESVRMARIHQYLLGPASLPLSSTAPALGDPTDLDVLLHALYAVLVDAGYLLRPSDDLPLLGTQYPYSPVNWSSPSILQGTDAEGAGAPGQFAALIRGGNAAASVSQSLVHADLFPARVARVAVASTGSLTLPADAPNHFSYVDGSGALVTLSGTDVTFDVGAGASLDVSVDGVATTVTGPASYTLYIDAERTYVVGSAAVQVSGVMTAPLLRAFFRVGQDFSSFLAGLAGGAPHTTDSIYAIPHLGTSLALFDHLLPHLSATGNLVFMDHLSHDNSSDGGSPSIAAGSRLVFPITLGAADAPSRGAEIHIVDNR